MRANSFLSKLRAFTSYLGRGQPTGLLLSGGIGFSGPVAKRAEPSQYAPATLRRMTRIKKNFLWSAYSPSGARGDSDRSTVSCFRVDAPGDLPKMAGQFH